MDVDWLADVRRFSPNADEGVVGKIVKYCGIALRTEDASKITFSEVKETDRVRENYLKKKLGLTDSDASLDAAVQTVGERMGGGDQNRVSVYYLLAEHFDMLEMFGGTKGSEGAATATAASATMGAATVAQAGSASAANDAGTESAAATTSPIATAMSSGGGASAQTPASHAIERGNRDDTFGIGCLVGVIALGAIALSALIAAWVSTSVLPERPEEPPASNVEAPPSPQVPAPASVVPEGSGVTASERDGRPMLTVYFDTGSADVTPDFETVSADLRAYLDANSDATVAISGFNDPSGNAEINAALSRDRAQNVQAALVALGIGEERTDLVRPDDTTTTDVTPEEARRVEIVIVE